jgi:hypothetical protein
MNEERKGILSKITIGNIIQIALIAGSIVALIIAMKDHLKDENIHIDNTEHKVITIEEYNNLIRFANTAEQEMPNIQKNTNRIIDIEKAQAVHAEQYKNLLQEESDLEDKVSRIYKELKEENGN